MELEIRVGMLEERFTGLERLVQDLIEVVKNGFLRMEERFEQIDEKFDQIDTQFDRIDRRFDQIDTQFNDIKEDTRGIHRSVNKLLIRDEYNEDRMLEHEERIGTLERWRKGFKNA